MERSSNDNKSLPVWFFIMLRFAPIITFVLLAVCSFAFYAAPSMTLMGETGENVYELAKMKEPFAKNLLIFAYVIIGVAVIAAVLFILPQTANKRYYVVWLHEIVVTLSTVLYVCVLSQVCRGMEFVKEWGFETGAGLILPLVFIILGLLINVVASILWRLFGGETALKADAQNYIATTVLLPKPAEVEKPLTRMPDSIRKCTKLYKKKCFYTIAMWGLISTLLTFVAGLSSSNNRSFSFGRGIHPFYMLNIVAEGGIYGVRAYGVGDWLDWAFKFFFVYALAIILITALVFRLGKQKKVWNFKRGNVWYAVGQLFLIAVAAAALYFSYSICKDMLNDRSIIRGVSKIALHIVDIRASIISAAVVVLLFMLFRMFLQIRIAKVKKSENFIGDVSFYESEFKAYSAEYKQYRAELRKYNRKIYRYRRAQTALE